MMVKRKCDSQMNLTCCKAYQVHLQVLDIKKALTWRAFL
jgi:hypothetical protein